MQQNLALGFNRCLVIGGGHPKWIDGLDLDLTFVEDPNGVTIDDLTLVIIQTGDQNLVERSMAWLDTQMHDVAPIVVWMSRSLSDNVMRLGVDLFIPSTTPQENVLSMLRAVERRFESAQRGARRLHNVTTKLAKVQAEFDAVDIELAEARKLQQALVNGQTVDFPKGRMSMFTRPHRHISGDLVGHFWAGKNQIGFFSIDVAGHGVTAALLTARIAGMLLGSAPDTNLALKNTPNGPTANQPSHVIAKMNALLFDDFETDHYFTCILGVINVGTGDIQFSQAGHPNPIIVDKTGACQSVGLGGLPVGLIPHAEFVDQTLTLEPGDRFVIHSDGITECTASDFTTQFGETRLQGLLSRHRPVSTNAVFETIIEELRNFHGHEKFDDDISGLTIDYFGPSKKDVTKCRSPEFASSDMASKAEITTAE